MPPCWPPFINLCVCVEASLGAVVANDVDETSAHMERERERGGVMGCLGRQHVEICPWSLKAGHTQSLLEPFPVSGLGKNPDPCVASINVQEHTQHPH